MVEDAGDEEEEVLDLSKDRTSALTLAERIIKTEWDLYNAFPWETTESWV